MKHTRDDILGSASKWQKRDYSTECEVCNGTGRIDWITYISKPENAYIKDLEKQQRDGEINGLKIRGYTPQWKFEIWRENIVGKY